MKYPSTLNLAMLAVVLLTPAARGEDDNGHAIRQAYQSLIGHAMLNEAERSVLKQRGQPAVYLPMGADDRGLLSELRQMNWLELCRFVNDESTLDGVSVLILPDLADYEPVPGRDQRIRKFLSDGGGVCAYGAAIAYLHKLGFAPVTPVPFRAVGNVSVALIGDNEYKAHGKLPAVLGRARPVVDQILKTGMLSRSYAFSFDGYMNEGPLFHVLPDSPMHVVGEMGPSVNASNTPGTPGMAYGKIGAARVVLVSGGGAGRDSRDLMMDAVPFESVTEPTNLSLRSPIRGIVQKNLLLYAAGDPSSPLAGEGEVGP